MVLQTRSQPHSGTAETAGRDWLMLAVLLLGQFMCVTDVLIVNVAMPSIGTRLHASGASLQLVVGGYTIAYAMLLITGARLGDRYGRRRTYLIGVIIFTAASLACALAPDSELLVTFRFIQGAGAAVLVPQVFSIIQLTFHGPARARALSAYAAVLSAGAVAGLILGGVIVTANLFGTAWRPVFAVNVPVGIVLAFLVPRLVPPDEPADGPSRSRSGRERAARGPGLDLRGLLVAVPTVLLIVLPLVLGREAGWPPWCFACVAAGAALAVVFVRLQRRVAARGGTPLLNLDVLRAPSLPSGLAALACTQVGYGGLLFAFTLHLQSGLHESALRAGLTYLPMAVTFGLASFFWRRLPARIGRVNVPAGLTASAVAYLGIAASPDGRDAALAWLALAGLGLGLSVSPLLTQSLVHVPPARAADASGLLTTTVQLGQLMGVTAIGSVYLSQGLPAAARWLAVLSAAGLLAALIMRRSLLCRTVGASPIRQVPPRPAPFMIAKTS